MEIIDFLNNFCDNICINTVYHKHDYEDIANIFKIISQFRGVKKWQVFELDYYQIIRHKKEKR
ncbi:hypothetical protein LKF24_0667 [Lactococcus lactis subsp. lactis]|nr:hypothetical protein LKF24_0667 [Lactococcus lactis subsp. lactis]